MQLAQSSHCSDIFLVSHCFFWSLFVPDHRGFHCQKTELVASEWNLAGLGISRQAAYVKKELIPTSAIVIQRILASHLDRSHGITKDHRPRGKQ